MKFTANEDFEAPQGFAFTRVSDFDGFERLAMKRGVDIVRTDDLPDVGVGMMWRVLAEFRNKSRRINLELVEFDPDNEMRFEAKASGMDLTMQVDLIPLSATRTRLAVELEAKPQTLSARLVIQSMRLTKGSLNRRFRNRIRTFARDIEDRARRGQTA